MRRRIIYWRPLGCRNWLVSSYVPDGSLLRRVKSASILRMHFVGDLERSCSQIRRTSQPSRLRVFVTRRSRRLLAMSLLFPKRPVVLRQIAVLCASVPETAVHKESKARAAKNKVWLPEHWLISPPSSDAVLPQELPEGEDQLGASVPD